jgi:hypothetical protein
LFQSTLGKLQSEISGQRALDYVAQIIGHHRIQASPGFRAAAAWCEQTLAANGIAHRIHSYTYDGHANYWASQSFEEWEGIDGTLDIVAPVTAAKRLCDFSALKISLIQRSAATPPGGVEADLVLLEDPENEAAYAALDLHGRLVLARGDLDRIRDLAVRKGGALGIVSDQMPEFPPVRERTDVPDARMYTSFWWTDPAEAKCFGFVLSPRQGDALRKLVKAENLAGRQVRVKAHVASRFYTGAIENVEGFIPGATDEEVLVVAHLCHPQASANDNASGCAAALEALRAIARLIGSGALPRPRRSIRLLLVPEFAGTYAFLAKNEGLIPKIVGGINLDMVGENQELCGSSFLVEKPPLALGSFAGDLAALILEAVASDVGNLGGTASYGLFRHAVTPFSGGSDHQALADPTVGVPCPMLIQWPDKFYHTSHDTLDKVDPKMLARAAAITATYAYFVAAAGDHEVAWLAGELAAGFAAQLATAGRAIIAGRDQRDLGERLAFLRDCRFADVTSLERLRDGSAADLAATASAAAKQRIKVEHAAGLAHYAALVAAAPVPHTVPAKTPLDDPAYAKVPRRTVRGPIGRREMFAKLSTADKQEWMTKAGQLAGAAGKDLRAIYGMAGTALFWTDGRRTLAEIAHLVTMESGWCDVAILHHLYEALARQGWIEYLD